MKNKILISLVLLFLLSCFVKEFLKIDKKITINPNYKSSIIISRDDVQNIENTSFIKPTGSENSKIENFKMTYQIKTESGENYSSLVNMEGTSNYSNLKGITTFRGNNYRENASFGTVSVIENTLTKIWTKTIGKTDNWTGIGWNGQPSIITWDEDVKKQMNIYEKFKEKENFTEVICGALDSYIHFYDLETGNPSRDAIKVESSIKGAVTLDPRGYPLLYVGQGIDKVSGEAVRFGYHIFSLIDGQELYFINGRDNFAYLGWGAFDGNPVIDAKTDTVILPGENGIIYIIKLNTNYDKTLGTISISPDVTRYRYTVNGYTGGTENSIVVHNNYAYFLNNSGILQCLNLNTLSPIWYYKMEDDCDATLGAEEENNTLMLYAACEVDRRKIDSPAYIKKINGYTGELVWEYSCDCKYDASVNGGVLSSPIIGKNELSNLVIFNIAKTTNFRTGKMVALDKASGNIVWEKDLAHYSWSSPTAVYTDNGKGYIIFADSNGQIHLINGKTGETLHSLQTGGGNFEGSPIVFNNSIIIGSRGRKIFRIDIK